MRPTPSSMAAIEDSAHPPRLVRDLAEARVVGLGPVQRNVGREVGEIEKEGLPGIGSAPLEERDRRIGLDVDPLAIVANGLGRVRQVRSRPDRSSPGRGRASPRSTRRSHAGRAHTRRRARAIEVPLPDHPGAIAGSSQPIREGPLGQWQRPAPVRLRAEAGLLATGQESGARGHALRGGDVAAREAHARPRRVRRGSASSRRSPRPALRGPRSPDRR